MSHRILAFVGSVALAAAAWSLTPQGVSAQAPKPGAPQSAVPRTADGHPDFTGMYDVSTMTPLQRPPEFGNRLTLTAEEANALEQYEETRYQKDRAPIQGEKPPPPVGGDKSTPRSFLETLFRAGGGAVGGYNLVWLNPGSRVITINGQKRTSIVVDPPDGKIPAMTPEARKKMAAFLAYAVSPDAAEGGAGGPAGTYDGPEARPLAERCLLGFGSTSGPPALPNYFYNNLKQIVQTRDSVMIQNEMVHDARVIRIGGQHLPKDVKSWMGDSIGHWEGDTLVVDTTNFTDKTKFQGSGENLHVIERFSRLDAKTLLYRFTIEDPTTWERPWTGEYPWVGTDQIMYEYACHEGNHALENVLRGARVGDASRGAAKPQ
ncbi:MAG: hypothetical protein DMF89_19395 [Acidobacteria bacterium]|nr:MAG: hypothetical protein DMF90_16730 [Acidobacteriota bacterium]PYR47250.1 MAG: hypothetical protein DMF89_19395 [Acidobacteriota bacterium]